MRILILLNIFFGCLILSAQDSPLEYDLNKLDTITIYENDPNASAIILFNKGEYSFVFVEGKLHFKKNIHKKIKILKESGKEYGVESIFLTINNKKEFEWTRNIKASTTNGIKKTYVTENEIFTKHHKGSVYNQTFAYPDVKVGSILELEYYIISPFFFNLEGWFFQSNIPTLYSKLTATIPAPLTYNKLVIGEQILDYSNAEVLEQCFPTNAGFLVYCKRFTYIMKDIPAFKDEEFMLSKKNYYSRIDFQLEKFLDYNMKLHRYTDDWKNVDKNFKKNKNIGKELKNNSFIKRKIPKSILSISDDLNRAKAIYEFVQNHFTWNMHYYSIFDNNDVKKAHKEKVGNAAEINLTLTNAFQAAGLNSKIALLSTRDNGLPIKRYASITDFNYLVTYLNINGKTYFLDATSKEAPFGVLPFQCLNYDARVMDFKKGSYWEIIKPYENNINFVNVQLKADENFGFSGKLRETNMGYKALNKRILLKEVNEKEYLKNIENEYGNVEIISYSVTDQNNIDNPIIEDFDIHLELEQDETLIINPFLFKEFKHNPFQLEERRYPVDFGHPTKYTYNFSLDISGKYELVELPKNQTIKMPDNMGETSVIYSEANGVIQMRFHLYLNEYHFESESYEVLKSFFNLVVQVQNNSPLLLKKI